MASNAPRRTGVVRKGVDRANGEAGGHVFFSLFSVVRQARQATACLDQRKTLCAHSFRLRHAHEASLV